MEKTCRPPAVAGMFYPGSVDTLKQDVHGYLEDATLPPMAGGCPKALLVPHAGYIYSGPTAGHAYAALRPFAGTIKRVVLFGPTHRIPVRGLAFPTVTHFTTPLGDVPLDRQAFAAIRDLPQVVMQDPPHALEHSLEVQLPFLQEVLPDFRLVPLAVGDATAEDVAEVMDRLWGGVDTVFLFSTDLSHFHDYDTANRLDQNTLQTILTLSGMVSHDQACGGTPVNGLILSAKMNGLAPQLLHHCNSGDTAGDKQRVVGYAAMAWHEPGGAPHE